MLKNVAGQTVGSQMITAADNSAFMGAVTVYVCGDAGSQTLGSVGSGVCTHEGNGYHTYAPAQAETNYDLIAFTFIGSGAIPATVQVFMTPTVGDIADAVWDEILTGATHNISTSAGRRLRQIAAFAIHSGIAQAGTTTTITLAAGASADSGVYNRNLVVIVEGTGAGQTRQIADYNGDTKVVSVDREWRITPDATSEYQITADNVFALVDQGKVHAATLSTITLRDYASDVNNTYLCNIIAIIAGTGRGQARLIGAYNGSTKVATICGNDWTTTPDNTSTYVMMPYGTTCASCIGDYALGLINAECALGIAKNAALSDFSFFMVLASDHVTAATGKTLTGTISKDGGAFVALTNSTAEISNGMYKVDITQAEMNADVITLTFTETDCDQRVVVIYTS